MSRERYTLAEGAVGLVRPGDRVFLGSACATPRRLMRALAGKPAPPPDLELLSFLTNLGEGVDLSRLPGLRQRVFFAGSEQRGLRQGDQLDYVPIGLEEVPELLRSGRLPVDVAMVQVSPPDARGFVSLGVSVDLAPAVLEVARRAIAEVVPSMPRTHGEAFVHVSRFDALVEVEDGVTEYRHPPVDAEVTRSLARYVAAIIEDGATLQVGLGRLPSEVLRHLTDRRDLGIHTDVLGDGVLDLVEAGVVTGRRKSRRAGRVVASLAVGTRRLYDALHDNPLFAFLPVEQVADPVEIAAQARMVALTQAFAVDLTGQACVDQSAEGFYGGLGCQPAFLRGAARSLGGKPVICLHAATPDGTQSRIRAALAPGEGVGIPRSDVHYVVTEYGIAHLFGRSIRERALALIEIAAPGFRAELLEEAKRLGYLARGQFLASHAPYPVEEERRIALPSGRQALLRPARAGDAAALQALFHRLTEEDRVSRFARRMRSLSLEEAQALCNVNHETDVAFLAVTGPREAEVVVGSGVYALDPRSGLAEVSLMVAPEWQGQGIGSGLLARLRDTASARGVRGFLAEMGVGNLRMLRLAGKAGGTITVAREDEVIRVTAVFAQGG